MPKETPIERIIAALDKSHRLELLNIVFDGDHVRFELKTRDGASVLPEDDVAKWLVQNDPDQREGHSPDKPQAG